jgi:hypothetical protein
MILLLALLGGFQQLAEAANITVKTSRNPVALDDSFHLIYEADSSVDDPDFSPIYQHFDVLSSSQSTNMRSINGNWSLKKSWDLTVIAKETGSFTLPPIQFGQDISPSIKITVTSSSSPNTISPDGQASIPAKIFLESTLDKKQGWVQEQFIYTTRLLRTVTIAGASLSDPRVSDQDAIVQLIGDDSYQTTRNGIRYEVYERRYAIFPQNSGKLTISPMRFEGRVNATQPRTIFDQFRMSGQIKRLHSNAVEAEVKPVPGNIPLQNWLPAKNVQLIEEWSDDIQNLTAGEPVTRTVTLIAEGLTGIQLGELDFPDTDGLKMYPDKAIDEDSITSDGVTGTKTFKVAIIPTRAGRYTLPGIDLAWWNTVTGKQQQVSIAETVLNVAPAAGSQQASPPGPVTPAVTDTSISQQSGDSEVRPQAGNAAVQVDDSWRFASFAFAAAWLITFLLLIREKFRSNHDDRQNTVTLSQLSRDVRKAIGNSDADATRAALIAWAKRFYGDRKILNLSHINTHCSAQLAEQIRLLSQALYADHHAEQDDGWHGAALLRAFEDENRNGPAAVDAGGSSHESALKPLYTKPA